MSSEIIERVVAAIEQFNLDEMSPDYAANIKAAARATIEALAELPEEPGPNYTAGEYSRRNIKAMAEDALIELSPLRPAGSADLYGVERAEE